MIDIFQCCYNFFLHLYIFDAFFSIMLVFLVLLYFFDAFLVILLMWFNQYILYCYKWSLYLYFCDAFNKCDYFVKYLSDFLHYLQGFQYWYHQISLISLFLFLYVSNLMIDIFQCCYQFFCIFISLMPFFQFLVEWHKWWWAYQQCSRNFFMQPLITVFVLLYIF